MFFFFSRLIFSLSHNNDSPADGITASTDLAPWYGLLHRLVPPQRLQLPVWVLRLFRTCAFFGGLTLAFYLSWLVLFLALYCCPVKTVSDHPRMGNPLLGCLCSQFLPVLQADPPLLSPSHPVIGRMVLSETPS